MADQAEPFRDLVLRHRGRTGLTQRELAARVGASRRAVQDWELGVNYPTADRLQALIVVLLEAGGLSVGHELQEAEELWAAVVREARRMHTTLDELWLAKLLADRVAPQQSRVVRAVTPAAPGMGASENDVVQEERRQDWGEAPDVFGFVDRAEELTTLGAWVLEERCRLVAVLGLGGIGKTTFAARLAQDVAPMLQRLYWRSLRDALPTSEWLAGAIGFLSDQRVVPPEGEAARLTLLLQLLRERPSLLVLDNFDTLVEPGQREGRYRDGYAGYGRLLQAIGEGRHRSCLVVTSRESPPELDMLGGGGVRTLQLGGLGVAEAQALLADKRLSGTTDEWAELIARYGGNGLALKVVGESIRQVFNGDVGAFLGESGSETVFAGIRRLLAEQIERSSAIERDVLRVLAVDREPLTVAELVAALGPRVGRGTVLDAVEALRRRSLVERAEADGLTAFTLQSVVLEYVTDRLVEEVADEITHGQPVLLVDQPLIKAQAKDYVRLTQERLIGMPLLNQLETDTAGGGSLERGLLALLDGWRNRPEAEQGYGPGNVVNLLRLLRGDLRLLELSHLSIRQAYLQEVEAQDASLVAVHLAEAGLAGAFNHPVSVALSADGRFMATGTSGGEVCLWRVADRTSLLAAHAHTGLTLVALSADGRLLASGGEDGTVKLWEPTIAEREGDEASARRTADSGHSPAAPPSGWQTLATLEGHTGAVRGVALSGDGRLLASGSSDGMVKLWEAPGGRLLATLQGHTGAMRGVALSADGRLLASGSTDGTINLWEASSGRLLATMRGHTSAVWSVAVSTDGALVASGSRDGTARLWEASSGRLLATMQGHTGTVWGVALSGDGRLLATGSFDATARLWEAPSGRPLATLQGHSGAVQGVALSGDGRLLASGGFDATARLWEVSSGRLLATLQGHAGAVWGVALSADGRLLASGNWDRTARVWDAHSGRLLATLQGHTGPVQGVALSGDGRLLASGSFDGMARLWEAPSGRLLASLEGHVGAIRGIALSGDGRLLASGSTDGTVRLWEAPSGRLLASLEGHDGAVWGVALSGDGRLLASGSTDGTVRLWEVTSGRMLATLLGPTGAVYGVALTWDGRLLASGHADGTARLWDADSERLLATLEGHTGPVQGVAISADGRLLASGSWDGTARLWKAESGRLLVTLRGHAGAVWGVAVSADGGLIASSSYDGTVRLWETSTGERLRTLRADRRYERMDITGLTGITDAQRQSMFALGATERAGV